MINKAWQYSILVAQYMDKLLVGFYILSWMVKNHSHARWKQDLHLKNGIIKEE